MKLSTALTIAVALTVSSQLALAPKAEAQVKVKAYCGIVDEPTIKYTGTKNVPQSVVNAVLSVKCNKKGYYPQTDKFVRVSGDENGGFYFYKSPKK